jgi:hypothetical protein
MLAKRCSWTDLLEGCRPTTLDAGSLFALTTTKLRSPTLAGTTTKVRENSSHFFGEYLSHPWADLDEIWLKT